MNKPEAILTKQEIEELLGTGVHTVTFYKVDGTLRTLSCTRDFDLIDAEHHPKNSGRHVATTTVSVFDMTDQVWKSFITENLVSIDN